MKGIFLKIEEAESILQQLNEINEKLSKSDPSKDQDEWLDSRLICKLLKISSRTLQKLRDEAKIPYTRLSGGIIRYRASDIDVYMNQNYVSGWKDDQR